MKQLVYCDRCGVVVVNIGVHKTRPGDPCDQMVSVTEHIPEPVYCGGTLLPVEEPEEVLRLMD